VLVGRLSSLVARARSVVTGTRGLSAREIGLFVTRRFPAAVYRAWRWWVAVGVVFVVVSVALAWWVASHPDVQAAMATPDQVRQLVDRDFAGYYSAHPAAAFAAQVWTNNAWLTALAVASGALLGIPIPYLLWVNASNVGAVAGLLAAHGKVWLFLGLVLPHGLLELTAVFIASGVGLRLGWTVVAPGDRPRGVAVAQEGRSAMAVAIGLVGVLLVSGLVEAFVTPSSLPTWVRLAIGFAVWGAFIAYVVVLGGRAVRAGETGDASDEDALPYA